MRAIHKRVLKSMKQRACTHVMLNKCVQLEVRPSTEHLDYHGEKLLS